MTVVALGSNLVPREQYLAAALRLLGELPQTRLVSASRVIETEGVDVPEEYRELKFLNQVAVFESSLEALEFSRRMHDIEDRLGRVRTVKNGPRTIDLDLVWHNGVILDTPELTLPHPRARERAFVMEPLKELGLAGLIKDAL
ncbi:MAG: 2-amino-4-hydroxy-6-hydroxymethyldihydropteridine diphosphokinase [Kiritimatiellae bacterium]|nr:2-amino-4-hydroxy-6-hydroxymethyldihydropteridine diphosphokinase [Kiritimatiellia bacterium]